jgi:hypothetical protein
MPGTICLCRRLTSTESTPVLVLDARDGDNIATDVLCTQVRKNKRCLKSFQQSEVTPDDVPYKDNAREAVRQKALRKQKIERRSSDQHARRRREGAVKPLASTQAKPDASASQAKKLPAAKRQLQQHRQDLNELKDDYTTLRKLKKGKLSEAAYEASLGLVD